MKRSLALSALMFSALSLAAEPGPGDKAPTTAEIIQMSQPSDWRRPDPADTLYMELATGRVIIELSPRIAPLHVANIKQLVHEKFFDGLPIGRVQDNYVVQWGDIDETHKTEAASRKVPNELVTTWGPGMPLVKLPDADGYAPVTGWIDGFPAGLDSAGAGSTWITHCYGVVGVGRDNEPDSGSGSELYVVIGQAPRHLDRNVVTVGRVLRGMELLSSLPRGAGDLGFYKNPKHRVPIQSIRFASDIPAAQRTHIEVLRTDTPLFTQYVEARRNRREEWFAYAANHIDVCNIAIPVRDLPALKP